MRKYTPKNVTKLAKNEVFVFGSNGNGNHAGGAAKLALEKFGAIQGQARGLQGQSYSIETLDKDMQKVPLKSLEEQFVELWKVARGNPDKVFLLTKVGTGIAGFGDLEVRDCFHSEDVPANVVLPKDWIYQRLWKSMPADMAPRGHRFEIGKWYFQEGKIFACIDGEANGFHASERVVNAISFVNCEVLALVEVRGEMDRKEDKQASQQMRIVEAHEWTKEQSVKLAIFAAESVLHIFEKEFSDDTRPREAIGVAKKWLQSPTEKNRMAARAAAGAAGAAGDAAWAAAGDAWAAGDAAWAVARDAARDAARAAAEAAACAAARAAAGAAEAADWAAAEAAARAAARAAWATWDAAGAAAKAAVLDKIEDYIQRELLGDFVNKK